MRTHRAKKHFVHDKTKFAKPPQEGYISLGQIQNYPKNTRIWPKSKNPE